MKLFKIALIISLVFVGFVEAQSKKSQSRSRIRPAKPAKTKLVKKPTKIISLGVINGKAIELVKPEFPAMALAVNVYGPVLVKVSVDEGGQVTLANVLKGHPLLRYAAKNAALKSTFEPMTLSGEPVRVEGIISYYFLPKQWNWLEIGFALNFGSLYYSTTNLEFEFPSGFNEEAGFLRQSRISSENWDRTRETSVAMIRSKLSIDEKAAWLFEVGLIIGKAKSICCRVEDTMGDLTNDLKSLGESAPTNTSSILLDKLRRLVFLVENPKYRTYSPSEGNQIYQLLMDMEDHLPFIGR